jgi:hypothetical protein
VVAAEEGLHAHICEIEAEAIAWLDAAMNAPNHPLQQTTGGMIRFW